MNLAGQSQIVFVAMTAVVGAGVGALMGQSLLVPSLVGAGLGYVVALSEEGKAGKTLSSYGEDEAKLLSRRNLTVLSSSAAGILVAQFAGYPLLYGGLGGLAAGYFIFKDSKY